MIGIYQIYNRTNDKQYIGSSVNISRRLAEHRYDLKNGTHHNGHLQNAWNKYGEKCFSFHLVEECDLPNLLEKEKWYLGNTPNLYNISSCPSAPMLGLTLSAEARKKIGLAHKGKRHTAEHIRKFVLATKGSHHTDEHCTHWETAYG